MVEVDPVRDEWWRLLRRAAVDGEDLEVEDTAWVMDQVMSGAADPLPLSNLLVGGASVEGFDLVEVGKMFTRITEAHTRRMAALGLAS